MSPKDIILDNAYNLIFVIYTAVFIFIWSIFMALCKNVMYRLFSSKYHKIKKILRETAILVSYEVKRRKITKEQATVIRIVLASIHDDYEQFLKDENKNDVKYIDFLSQVVRVTKEFMRVEVVDSFIESTDIKSISFLRRFKLRILSFSFNFYIVPFFLKIDREMLNNDLFHQESNKHNFLQDIMNEKGYEQKKTDMKDENNEASKDYFSCLNFLVVDTTSELNRVCLDSKSYKVIVRNARYFYESLYQMVLELFYAEDSKINLEGQFEIHDFVSKTLKHLEEKNINFLYESCLTYVKKVDLLKDKMINNCPQVQIDSISYIADIILPFVKVTNSYLGKERPITLCMFEIYNCYYCIKVMKGKLIVIKCTKKKVFMKEYASVQDLLKNEKDISYCGLAKEILDEIQKVKFFEV